VKRLGFAVLAINPATWHSPLFTDTTNSVDKLSHRVGLHFLHHTRAMNLDRLLYGSKIVGNLHIQLSGDNVIENFTLARCQCLQPLLNLVYFGAGLPGDPIFLQALKEKTRAPLFMACTLAGTVPWPVRKIIGMMLPLFVRASCNSRPFKPGMATSSTRQPGA
jgi:hypothetical protein